jgi:glycosyltransferase involved in cell wall biosynthesis
LICLLLSCPPLLKMYAKPGISQYDKVPRVILSIRHFYPDGGGAEVLARRLAVGLVQRGVQLTVLTGRYIGRSRLERIDGVLVRRHFIGLYVPVLHELCYLTSLARELVTHRREYEIIHVFQTNLSAYLAVVLAKRLRKKVLTTAHGAGATGDIALWSSIPLGSWLLRHVCANVDGSTGVSNRVMAELHDAGFDGKRTWHITNGVPIPPLIGTDPCTLRSSLGLRSDAFIGVFVGRLADEKAPEVLLEAWMAVLQRYSSSQLIFVGDGEKRAMLEAKTRQAGFGESIVFTGQVHNVEEYLNAADIFVLPSTTEGMSIALLEAMAVGLPVVASRVSGTVDVIRHGKNGLLFEPGDVEGLVGWISSLIEMPERRTELGRMARETVEQQFSLNRTADAYVELYKKLISEKRRDS